MAFSSQFAVPRVAAYKAASHILGIGVGHTRPPFVEPSDEAMVALRRTVDRLGLRDSQGLG